MNKIEKVNMTKLDYTARKLGIVGLLILTLTFAFGGTILVDLFMENQTLTNALINTREVDESHKVNENLVIDEYIITIE